MEIEIKYFGMIAEVTGKPSEVLEFSAGPISSVKEHLFATYPELQQKNFRIAQDQELVADNAPLNGREIAILPPFAGG
ncbi:MoaD/ThiS family protein [Maribacter sp. 2307ULW6-5]|uniref:MoaD/ThiS family protein n=1 Tax=Maribacter sp. 2307ULW6-5 TaxID=3386275 RepID=UPI0039BCAEFB